jgi:hypothetical protein
MVLAYDRKRTEVDMSGYRFSAYVIRDNEGWAAVCPEFPDCRARGATTSPSPSTTSSRSRR